jgi:hypothetical protein
VIALFSEWTFRDFLDRRQVNVVREWLHTLPSTAQAKIDSILMLLRVMKTWPPQYVSTLRGYEGIYEIRAGSHGVQYRPLGCYGPDRKEFTILIGAVEKGGKLSKSECQTAVERRKIILGNYERTCEHKFD